MFSNLHNCTLNLTFTGSATQLLPFMQHEPDVQTLTATPKQNLMVITETETVEADQVEPEVILTATKSIIESDGKQNLLLSRMVNVKQRNQDS